jgi:hypothetical protein
LGYSVLSDPDAREIEELTAIIFPTTETPGAREAGVIWFVDAALSQAPDEDRESVSADVADMRRALEDMYPGKTSLTELSEPEQIAFAESIQDTEFFRETRRITITALFSHPRHGGNRDKVGWSVLGFDDRHVWQPPFGHYDAPYHEDDASA